MIRKLVLVLFIAAIGVLGGVEAYGQDAATLAAGLDKNKHKKKEKSKNGVSVSVEVYVDIKNVPAVKQPAEYSGQYVSDGDGYILFLEVAADGSAQGRGTDGISGDPENPARGFLLRNARVRDAVLTADKAYQDGTTERLEAVFVTRTTATGKNAENIESRDSKFGLGFIRQTGNSTSRVFLAAK